MRLPRCKPFLWYFRGNYKSSMGSDLECSFAFRNLKYMHRVNDFLIYDSYELSTHIGHNASNMWSKQMWNSPSISLSRLHSSRTTLYMELLLLLWGLLLWNRQTWCGLLSCSSYSSVFLHPKLLVSILYTHLCTLFVCGVCVCLVLVRWPPP